MNDAIHAEMVRGPRDGTRMVVKNVAYLYFPVMPEMPVIGDFRDGPDRVIFKTATYRKLPVDSYLPETLEDGTPVYRYHYEGTK